MAFFDSIFKSKGPTYTPMTSTSQSSSNPWGPQQPYLKDVFGQAQSQFNKGPMSQTTQQGLDLLTQRATDPNGAIAGASRMIGDTVNGAYLNSNPYVDKMFNSAADSVGQQFRNNTMPGLNGAFSKGGRLGSTAYANAANSAANSYGTTLNNLATNIYGQNYANERNNQMQAAGMAPQIGAADARMLMEAGQFQDNAPWQNIARYKDAVGGNYGGTSSGTNTGMQMTSQGGPSLFQQLLGGGMSAAGLAGMLGFL